MIDVNEIRSLIDKHGPPLSPMLIFTLLDEIERLRAELAVAQERNSELLPIAAQCVRAVCHEHAVGRLERAEAAIARVRELCAAHAGDDDIPRANVLTAIEGEQTGNHLD